MKEITGTIYEASDGKKFLDEEACIAYEEGILERKLSKFLSENWGINPYTDAKISMFIIDHFDKIKEIVEQN